MTLKEGDKAPDFKLGGDDGKAHALGEFKGKYLVLYFYPRDDTPGCTIEAKGFTERIGEIKKLGADVVGISDDQYESHCRFRDKYGLKVLLLSDPMHKTIEAYGAWGNRGVFGVGTIRTTFVLGKDARILKIFEKVRPDGHPQEIIDFLKTI